MNKLAVVRIVDLSQPDLWARLTEPRHFEARLPAVPGSARLDVRTGGSWRATVTSAQGHEIGLTGRYDEVVDGSRIVMTVPGDAVAAIDLAAAEGDRTRITYTFDADESMREVIEASVDDILGRMTAS